MIIVKVRYENDTRKWADIPPSWEAECRTNKDVNVFVNSCHNLANKLGTVKRIIYYEDGKQSS